MEKLIFPVSVTQKEQLSGVFIFDFEKSAFLAHPSRVLDLLCTSSYKEILLQIRQYNTLLDAGKLSLKHNWLRTGAY